MSASCRPLGCFRSALRADRKRRRSSSATPYTIISSFPNKVFALDSVSGDLKWTYVPNQDRAAQGVACCDVLTRGIAYDDSRIFLVTLG